MQFVSYLLVEGYLAMSLEGTWERWQDGGKGFFPDRDFFIIVKQLRVSFDHLWNGMLEMNLSKAIRYEVK